MDGKDFFPGGGPDFEEDDLRSQWEKRVFALLRKGRFSGASLIKHMGVPTPTPVYRTLRNLLSRGKIHPLISGFRVLFSVGARGTYFVCAQCGKVEELAVKTSALYPLEEEEGVRFIAGATLVYFGLCEDCL